MTVLYEVSIVTFLCKVHILILMYRLTLMYKLSHNLVDINTEEHLIPNSELRTRNSHAFKYRMPKVSKDVFKFSFFPRSITEWNSLPADLVNCKSLSDFKLHLGKHVK